MKFGCHIELMQKKVFEYDLIQLCMLWYPQVYLVLCFIFVALVSKHEDSLISVDGPMSSSTPNKVIYKPKTRSPLEKAEYVSIYYVLGTFLSLES